RNSALRLTSARGLMTLVNTIDGPQNTWSSSLTPSYSDTLFWMRQFSPTVTLPTYTFCPRTQRGPILAPGDTWQKCQIFLPAPMSAAAAMYALAWAKSGVPAMANRIRDVPKRPVKSRAEIRAPADLSRVAPPVEAAPGLWWADCMQLLARVGDGAARLVVADP